MKKIFFGFLFFCAPILLLAQSTTDDTTYKPVAYPDGYTAQIDVVYVKVADWNGRMDLYLPPNTGRPTAIVMNIHGGGWNHGVKESQTGYSSFFKEKMAVANMEYRLTGQATAPAAVEDTRCALIYLIKNAKALNIDVNKIVIMGGSAGGHLALMGGLLANDKKFDGNCSCNETVKVAAIINKYGITDVWDWAYGKNVTSKSANRWLGDKQKEETFAQSVSPIFYVNKKSPPTFIVHGDADPTVPYQQSVALHKKFLDMGVKTEFMTVPSGLHGKFEKEKNSEINKAIIQFIKDLKII